MRRCISKSYTYTSYICIPCTSSFESARDHARKCAVPLCFRQMLLEQALRSGGTIPFILQLALRSFALTLQLLLQPLRRVLRLLELRLQISDCVRRTARSAAGG